MPEEPTETPTVIYPDNGKSRSNAVAMVTLLDGELLEIHLDRKAKGEDILEKVAKKLELTEKDYFGLSFKDKTNRRTWLDLDKRASKILKGDPWKLDFEVKFYPKDPSQLQEDLTRYLLCLQVRNDILSGKLPCSFVTYAMLGSYLVQSQLGDYSAEEYPDASYLSGFKFSPRPEPGLEEKVMSLHKGHKGQTPADAELHYLENAKKLTLYGVDMHPAKDSENVDIQLGVCSTGILVYQDMLRMNRFAWPKILKISYRRNNFYIKIRPGEFEQYEQTVVFKLDSSRAAKNLWKVCVDQHTFFRLMSADATKRPAFPFIRIGSKYGIGNKRKTQAELMDIPKSDNKNFDRTYSLPRFSRSMDEIGGNRLAEDNKRGSTLPTRPLQTSPKKAEKQKPPGGVAVLPKEPFSKNKKELIDKDKESNGHRNEIDDDEKENRSEQLSKSPTTPTKQFKKDDSKKQSPGSLITDIFGSGKKEPKKTKGKDDEEKKKDAKTDKKKSRSKEKIAEAEKVPERKEKATEDEGKVNPYTKVYEYEEEAENSDRSPRIGGFSYEKGDTKSTTQEPKSPTTEGRKGVATAFNYAPGDINKLEDETGKKNIFSLFSKKSPKGKEDEKKSKTEDDKQSKTEEEKKSSKLDFLKPKSEEKKKKDTEGDSSSKKSPKDKTEDAKQSEDEKKSSKLDFLKPKSDEKKKKDTEGDSPSKKSLKDKTEDAKQSKEDEKKSSKLDFLKPKSEEKKKKDTEGDSSKSKSPKSKEDEKKSKTEEEKKSSKFLKPKDDKKKDKPKPEEGEKKSKLGSLLKSKTEGKKKKAEDQDRSIEEKDRSQTEDFLEAERTVVGSGPRVVKTTTKSTMGLSDGTLTQNVEEKIEDMTTGEVNISTTVNTAEGLDNTKSPFITAVTTRTATTVEDIDKNERTSQVEEKTVARSTTQKGLRQEQRVVTQEVRATTVVNEPQIKKSGSQSSLSSDDSGTPIDGESATYWTDKPQGPIVETERVLYGPVSEVEEQSATNFTSLSDVIVSSQTITSKTRTVETLTYKTEKDGVVETRVEQKITIQSDGDPVDHDKALAEAIQEATAMNPDMRVEKIEIQQEQLP